MNTRSLSGRTAGLPVYLAWCYKSAPQPRLSLEGTMLTGAYRFPPMESVIYGRPFAEALKEQVEASGAHAVFLLASGTLNRETDMVGQVRHALGNRLAGVHARIGAHTPRDDAVGRRIHRLGRLYRHRAQHQGELRPQADDAEERRARPARHDPHAGVAVPVDRHPRRRPRRRGHLLARVPADLRGRFLPRA